MAQVKQHLWNACHAGEIAPHIYKVGSPHEVMQAHYAMRQRSHYGKMLIEWNALS